MLWGALSWCGLEVNMVNIGDDAQVIDMISLMKDPAVIKLYVNGMTCGSSLSDVFMVVNSGPVPTAVIQMSFTMAKTMMLNLHQVITEFEAKTGQSLLTMNDIKEKFFGESK
jgi:hypothetical protein